MLAVQKSRMVAVATPGCTQLRHHDTTMICCKSFQAEETERQRERERETEGEKRRQRKRREGETDRVVEEKQEVRKRAKDARWEGQRVFKGEKQQERATEREGEIERERETPSAVRASMRAFLQRDLNQTQEIPENSGVSC